ncbi:MAG TPA: S-layer homology domain-containing protein, partial [Armatimonadota bacterium]|nr:S-layer homology domain-containing protein [Armatimonadota bacterium]
MLKTALSIGLLLLLAVPVFAQGPFADVPPDHWAYEAVNELQEDGILIGYPDGTFRGNRAITRYEFAVAIARMVPVLEQRILEQVADMLEDIDV